MIITVVPVSIELVLGMLLALAMHRAIFGRGAGPGDRADPLRDRHRGGRLLLALRLGGWTPAGSRTCSGSTHRPARLDVRQLRRGDHRRDLEDDAVHGAAAARRSRARARRAARGGASVDGATAWQRFWRITIPLMKPAILVALLFRTLDAFRIFDTVLHLQRRRARHRDGLDPRPTTSCSTGSTSGSARRCRC